MLLVQIFRGKTALNLNAVYLLLCCIYESHRIDPVERGDERVGEADGGREVETAEDQQDDGQLAPSLHHPGQQVE